jgi:hypothetical protein
VRSQPHIFLVINAVLIIKNKLMVWMYTGHTPVKTSQERIHAHD